MNKQSIKHIGILEPTVSKDESVGEQVLRRMPIKSIGETETRGGGIFYRRRKLTKRFIKTPKRRAHSRKVVRPSKAEVGFTIVIGPPSYIKHIGLFEEVVKEKIEEVMKASKPAMSERSVLPVAMGMAAGVHEYFLGCNADK